MDSLSREVVIRLWDEHGDALVLYARQFCETPEDVVQEAFLLLARQDTAVENPVGWMYRVVRNRARQCRPGPATAVAPRVGRGREAMRGLNRPLPITWMRPRLPPPCNGFRSTSAR